MRTDPFASNCNSIEENMLGATGSMVGFFYSKRDFKSHSE